MFSAAEQLKVCDVYHCVRVREMKRTNIVKSAIFDKSPREPADTGGFFS